MMTNTTHESIPASDLILPFHRLLITRGLYSLQGNNGSKCNPTSVRRFEVRWQEGVLLTIAVEVPPTKYVRY